MKSFFLFFTQLMIVFSASAAVEHTCVATKSDAEISKIIVSYADLKHTLTVFHNTNLVEKIRVEESNDISFVAFYSDTPPYVLTIDQDTSGKPTADEALLEYGQDLKKRLYFYCD